jgi:mono/diheme cytochrome c family protein
MAGGRPMTTPFGAVYSTNITPDVDTGIGGWTDDEFVNSMTKGIGPEGEHFFPVFPYTSFTRMRRQDLLDLKAYLLSLPAVRQEAPPPEMPIPFRWRFTLAGWKMLFLDEGPLEARPDSSDEWNRGAYLVEALAHCAECHSPRNLFGAVQTDRRFTGTANGPEGERAPNITPDGETGIGDWSTADMVWFLQTGLYPDGDSTQGTMLEVIDNGYAHMSEEDLRAIDRYLRSLAPVHNVVE